MAGRARGSTQQIGGGASDRATASLFGLFSWKRLASHKIYYVNYGMELAAPVVPAGGPAIGRPLPRMLLSPCLTGC
jgi:hypothetical protein